jgi:hypothetical protein
MQTKGNATNLLKLIACAAFICAAAAQAEDKKADPSGTWYWTAPGRNGGPGRTNTLVLKLEGDKLTGALSMPRRGGEMVETPIKDAKVTGDDVSFSVTREFGGNSMTSRYSGKVTGDSIKGKIEFERDGGTQSRDWEAKRQTAKADKPEKSDKTVAR